MTNTTILNKQENDIKVVVVDNHSKVMAVIDCLNEIAEEEIKLSSNTFEIKLIPEPQIAVPILVQEQTWPNQYKRKKGGVKKYAR